MDVSGPFQIQRVGFRHGTDDELAALHAIESRVEAERRPDLTPKPLDSYRAFARTISPQFDDHAWLAIAPDATPAASAFCWSNDAGDPTVMECDIMVRNEYRRLGIGTRLIAAICDETAANNRVLLTWSTCDAAPSGESFSRWLSADVGRVNRTSELTLDTVDWRMISRWTDAKKARLHGYSIDFVEGAIPADMLDDAVRFHHIMQTAPQDDLAFGDATLDAGDIDALDQSLIQAKSVN